MLLGLEPTQAALDGALGGGRQAEEALLGGVATVLLAVELLHARVERVLGLGQPRRPTVGLASEAVAGQSLEGELDLTHELFAVAILARVLHEGVEGIHVADVAERADAAELVVLGLLAGLDALGERLDGLLGLDALERARREHALDVVLVMQRDLDEVLVRFLALEETAELHDGRRRVEVGVRHMLGERGLHLRLGGLAEAQQALARGVADFPVAIGQHDLDEAIDDAIGHVEAGVGQALVGLLLLLALGVRRDLAPLDALAVADLLLAPRTPRHAAEREDGGVAHVLLVVLAQVEQLVDVLERRELGDGLEARLLRLALGIAGRDVRERLDATVVAEVLECPHGVQAVVVLLAATDELREPLDVLLAAEASDGGTRRGPDLTGAALEGLADRGLHLLERRVLRDAEAAAHVQRLLLHLRRATAGSELREVAVHRPVTPRPEHAREVPLFLRVLRAEGLLVCLLPVLVLEQLLDVLGLHLRKRFAACDGEVGMRGLGTDLQQGGRGTDVATLGDLLDGLEDLIGIVARELLVPVGRLGRGALGRQQCQQGGQGDQAQRGEDAQRIGSGARQAFYGAYGATGPKARNSGLPARSPFSDHEPRGERREVTFP